MVLAAMVWAAAENRKQSADKLISLSLNGKWVTDDHQPERNDLLSIVVAQNIHQKLICSLNDSINRTHIMKIFYFKNCSKIILKKWTPPVSTSLLRALRMLPVHAVCWYHAGLFCFWTFLSLLFLKHVFYCVKKFFFTDIIINWVIIKIL